MVSIPHPVPTADLDLGELVLALDIGGTKLAAGVVDRGGQVLALVRTQTPRPGAGWRAASNALFDLGHAAIDAAEVSRDRIVAVGIGSGGPLDVTRGVILGPPNLPDWDDVPVALLAASAFDLPAFLENDANAAAMASFRWGDHAGTKDLVYLTISTGIGGGVLSDGRLLRGRSGNVAEFGHTVMVWGGRDCHCGQSGCAEAYVSGTAIAERAREALASGAASSLTNTPSLTAADVAAAAAAGDGLSVAIWTDAMALLGALVTSAINIFEPRVVVLGGGVTGSGAMLIEPVRDYARRSALSPAGRDTEVVISNHGEAIGVLGAAAVAMIRAPMDARIT